MTTRQEIEIAFLAVNNGHITFASLAKVFHPRLVRQYLLDAIVFTTPPIADYNGKNFHTMLIFT